MSTDQPVDPQTIEQTKHQIRGLVNEISQLSKEDLSDEQYYGEFLQRVVTALAAVGGAVWTVGDGGRLELTFQINMRMTELGQEGEDQQRHGRLIHQAMRKEEGMLVPPYSFAGEDQKVGNPTRFLLVLAPLPSDEGSVGVIEIFQRSDAGPATQRGYLKFLRQMCDLAGGWIKSGMLRQFSDRQSLWSQIDSFSRAVHESLDPRETAYAIANEGRRLVECDRVSVAIRKGRKCTIESISGQDTFDKRSNTVVMLGKLATRVVAAGEPLWYTGATDDLPPQIEEILEEYVDEAHSKTIAVLPLKKPERTGESLEERTEANRDARDDTAEAFGAVIIEQIEDITPRAAIGQKVDLVCEHSSRALANVAEHNSIFLMPLWRTIGKSRWIIEARTLPKTIAVAATILFVLVTTIVMPMDFNLEGRGELLPVNRKDIFPASEGMITEVHVKHGQLVEEGDLLLTMENTDLDIQLKDVQGKLRGEQENIGIYTRSAKDARLSPIDREKAQAQLMGSLNQIDTLQAQYKMLLKLQEDLEIRSPISGQVTTFDVAETLLGRTVTPAQGVLRVADTSADAEWELFLYMPEDRMGHVARAQEKLQRQDLPVTYVLASNANDRYEGNVAEVDLRAQPRDDLHTVRVRVKIDSEALKDPRLNTTVTGKIYAGRRPVAYVILRDVIEFVQTRVLF